MPPMQRQTILRAKRYSGPYPHGLACSKGATDPCKIGAVGSIPIQSTLRFVGYPNGKEADC